MIEPKLVGEVAALATAMLWAVGTLVWSRLSERTGAFAVNLWRITLGALVWSAVHGILRGAPLPSPLAPRQALLLATSALLGLAIGDLLLFRALVLVGARRATLLATLAPAFTVAIGWVFLHERLSPRSLAGIAVTLLGVAWVVRERSPSASTSGSGPGTLLGAGAALCQAVGLTLTKAALPGLGAFPATVVRLIAAAFVVWVAAFALGRVRGTLAILADRRLLLGIALGTLLGPILGVWLSLVAIEHTETAVAATLMSLVPVLVIPLTALVEHERPTPRAVTGAVLAVVGVAILTSR